jgi:hypothetical protein
VTGLMMLTAAELAFLVMPLLRVMVCPAVPRV